jgi:predicted site-specific integrase-resolvase
MDKYLTPGQVAERYQVSIETLKDWRYRGVGPDYLKAGKSVRYRESALERWERKQETARRASA